jgi:hypothetical protein
MPARFETYSHAKARLMKDALEAAWLRCRCSRADEAKIMTLLASAIVDQVNAGKWDRQRIVDAALASLAVASIYFPPPPLHAAAAAATLA